MSSRTKLLASLICLLSLAAVGVSGYLTWTTWGPGTVTGCTGNSLVDCDEVLASRWSKWLGAPVSLFGTLTYVGILALGWPAARRPHGLAWTGLLTFSLLAAGAAIWFTGLQVLALQRFCPYCLTVHVCGLTICVLTLWMSRDSDWQESDYDRMRDLLGVADSTGEASSLAAPTLFGKSRPFAAVAASLLGLVLLIGGQLLFPTKSLVLETIADPQPAADQNLLPGKEEQAEVLSFTLAPDQEDENDARLDTQPHTGDNAGRAARRVTFPGLPNGLNVAARPLLGFPNAKHVLVEMMDYTCRHCRRLHPRVLATRERYGDEVAFIIYHAPLNKRCNKYVKHDQRAHLHACDYAKLAWSVWKLAPAKFPEFHNWLLESEKPPPILDAREKALRLAGDAVLIDESILADANRTIAANCSTHNSLGGILPLILTRKGAIRGVPNSEEEWFQFLETELGFTPVSR